MESSRRWLEKAIDQGDANAAKPLGELLWRQNDPAAEAWLRPQAQKGDTEAMVRLAETLLRNTPDVSVAKSKEAHRLLAQAAQRDHSRALLLLGRSHVDWLRDGAYDPHVPHSPKKAVMYLERAAAQRTLEAHCYLARIYEHRGFAQRNLPRAREHLEKAARAGFPDAQIGLARNLIKGSEVLEASLDAGYWLCAAIKHADFRAEAEGLLEQIAPRAPDWSHDKLNAQNRLLPLVAEVYPRLAVRLTLAARFGLTTREALFLDLSRVDQEWCLLAEIGQYFRYKPWRLVRCVTDEQREALRTASESVRPSFRGEEDVFPSAQGSTRVRAKRLQSLLGQMAIDPSLFIMNWKPE